MLAKLFPEIRLSWTTLFAESAMRFVSLTPEGDWNVQPLPGCSSADLFGT
jgi:hypothetical protein